MWCIHGINYNRERFLIHTCIWSLSPFYHIHIFIFFREKSAPLVLTLLFYVDNRYTSADRCSVACDWCQMNTLTWADMTAGKLGIPIFSVGCDTSADFNVPGSAGPKKDLHQTNTIHWPGVGLMVGHRPRRWPIIKPTPDRLYVFAVMDSRTFHLDQSANIVDHWCHQCLTKFFARTCPKDYCGEENVLSVPGINMWCHMDYLLGILMPWISQMGCK